MSEYVNYSMYAELPKGRICQSLQLSDPTLAQNIKFCCVYAKKKKKKNPLDAKTSKCSQQTFIAPYDLNLRFHIVLCLLSPLVLNYQHTMPASVLSVYVHLLQS